MLFNQALWLPRMNNLPLDLIQLREFKIDNMMDLLYVLNEKESILQSIVGP